MGADMTRQHFQRLAQATGAMWCEMHHVVGENAAAAIFETIIDQLSLACGEFNPGFKYDRFRDACYKAARLPVPAEWRKG
jgi:hypothetical protein